MFATDAIVGEIADVGLGVLRRADVVFGCLDNEMARVELGWACVRTDRPLVDGGLGNINPSSGMVLVFPGRDGPMRVVPQERRAASGAALGAAGARGSVLAQRAQPGAGGHRADHAGDGVDRGGVASGARHPPRARASDNAHKKESPTGNGGGAAVATGHAYRVQLHPGPTFETRGFDRSPSCPLHEPETFLQDVETRMDRRSSAWLVRDLLQETGAESLQLDWPITARAACRRCGETWQPLVRRARFRRMVLSPLRRGRSHRARSGEQHRHRFTARGAFARRPRPAVRARS